MAAKLDTASVVYRNRVRAEGEEVSDAKVRFLIEVVDVNSLSISPREAIHLKIAAVNVRAVYANLRKTLDTPRVRLLADPLNDRDPNDVKAQLEFTYQRSDERTIMDALAKAGDELSRTEERNHEKRQRHRRQGAGADRSGRRQFPGGDRGRRSNTRSRPMTCRRPAKN